MLVGMGLYSTDTLGTGGSIKEKREDFAVNEVLAEKTLSRITENTGYAVYKLDKNGIDTNHALAEVQKRTGVRLKALGLKDSRAVTSQYVCATSKMAKISKYDGGRFSIKQIGFSKRPTAKDMIGNRFSIRVSGTDADLSEFIRQNRSYPPNIIKLAYLPPDFCWRSSHSNMGINHIIKLKKMIGNHLSKLSTLFYAIYHENPAVMGFSGFIISRRTIVA